MADGTTTTTTDFDSGAYCSTGGGVAAVDGKTILTCIFSSDGSKLLAIDGEQEAKLSLEADTKSFSSKDSKGGWQTNSPSTKSWSLDLDTVQVKDAESNLVIRKAFEDGAALCFKQVYDDGKFTPRCGGSAYVTKYEDDAPSDDVDSISISLTGTGKLTWFDIDTASAAKATAIPSNRTA
jgi:TP901-1 family phage major tail protein